MCVCVCVCVLETIIFMHHQFLLCATFSPERKTLYKKKK